MKHYLSDNKTLVALEQDGSQDFLITPQWKELTDEEAEAIRNPPLTDEQITAQKVQEALAFLASTDFKDLPRYTPKEGEDMGSLYAKRDEARAFVRANK